MADKQFETAELIGVNYHIVNHSELLSYIEKRCMQQMFTNVFNVNIHAMNLAFTNSKVKSIINQGDMVFVDGYGVKLGAKLAGKPIGERLTPMDWIDDLFALCVKHQWKFFLLGDVDEALQHFEKKLNQKYPQKLLAGCHHGFFQREGEENNKVIELINQSGAEIILVGMSMPIQEEWIWANKDKLTPFIRISTGAMHRVYTGDISRAPAWVTDNGFEWLYRFCVEPKKTWRRYILGNPLFIWRVLKQKLLGYER